MTTFTNVAEADTRPEGFRVVLYTQVYSDDRPKGGGEWIIAQPTASEVMAWVNSEGGIAQAMADLAGDAGVLLPDWSGWREIRQECQLLSPGELAASEADQLEYSGRITYPARDIFLWRHISDKADRLREAA
ncbi:MAG: hypothetical protein EPN91_11630 [Salinibacterium sp.]|nr:MAG: hypothetical protein EPN91_11630 [Salinibacterium sp.]